MAQVPSGERPARPFAQTERHDAVAACLAVLVRWLCENGASLAMTQDALRAAPDRIEAALTRPGALVLYRLGPDGAEGIVSQRDEVLRRFALEAMGGGLPLYGLNPFRVAACARLVRLDQDAEGSGEAEEATMEGCGALPLPTVAGVGHA